MIGKADAAMISLVIVFATFQTAAAQADPARAWADRATALKSELEEALKNAKNTKTGLEGASGEFQSEAVKAYVERKLGTLDGQVEDLALQVEDAATLTAAIGLYQSGEYEACARKLTDEWKRETPDGVEESSDASTLLLEQMRTGLDKHADWRGKAVAVVDKATTLWGVDGRPNESWGGLITEIDTFVNAGLPDAVSIDGLPDLSSTANQEVVEKLSGHVLPTIRGRYEIAQLRIPDTMSRLLTWARSVQTICDGYAERSPAKQWVDQHAKATVRDFLKNKFPPTAEPQSLLRVKEAVNTNGTSVFGVFVVQQGGTWYKLFENPDRVGGNDFQTVLARTLDKQPDTPRALQLIKEFNAAFQALDMQSQQDWIDFGARFADRQAEYPKRIGGGGGTETVSFAQESKTAAELASNENWPVIEPLLEPSRVVGDFRDGLRHLLGQLGRSAASGRP